MCQASLTSQGLTVESETRRSVLGSACLVERSLPSCTAAADYALRRQGLDGLDSHDMRYS